MLRIQSGTTGIVSRLLGSSRSSNRRGDRV